MEISPTVICITVRLLFSFLKPFSQLETDWQRSQKKKKVEFLVKFSSRKEASEEVADIVL